MKGTRGRTNEKVKLEYILILAAALILIIFALSEATTSTRHMMQHGNNYNYLLLIVVIILLIYPVFKEIESKHSEGGIDLGETTNVTEDESIEWLSTKKTNEKVKEVAQLPEMVKKLLKEDEKRVMEIIFENEGITQDSLHFRTGFSQSKVTMIIKKLEEKDLIVRERFGRTYKLYLSEQLMNQE